MSGGTAELARQIAEDPRFLSDNGGFFREIAAEHGETTAGHAWMQALLRLAQGTPRQAATRREAPPMRISERDAQAERNDYDSECMARDVADAIDATMNAEIGETFTRGLFDHAFNVVTPHGRSFLITVQESHQL